jgi:hypothetical protein
MSHPGPVNGHTASSLVTDSERVAAFRTGAGLRTVPRTAPALDEEQKSRRDPSKVSLSLNARAPRFKRDPMLACFSGVMGQLWNPEVCDRIKRLHQQMREAN